MVKTRQARFPFRCTFKRSLCIMLFILYRQRNLNDNAFTLIQNSFRQTKMLARQIQLTLINVNIPSKIHAYNEILITINRILFFLITFVFKWFILFKKYSNVVPCTVDLKEKKIKQQIIQYYKKKLIKFNSKYLQDNFIFTRHLFYAYGQNFVKRL